ncbi:uncharacterized protein LOC6537624 isoform X2 [Drosophila yakuba]|uniref:uncharacterized protein LOC6537624 isoform X2 n=1 Tax=Drosophila yakuba TaxID=7245 RepID=UPI00193086F2|nr:uncharacterized protein LOC6537624 isoform X2 [Drosophila yakuba]
MRSWKSRSRSKMQTLETRTRLLQGAQLTQLLLGAILCLTIASHTQTSAEAAGGRASGPGADRTSQGAGTSSASASASAASMAISSDESGDPSSATAFSSLAQVSSLLPEASALSATSGLVEPYLDGYATSNVTTQIGTHAYLPCRGRLHSRPAIPGHQAAGQVLDPADQVRPGPGRRLLRVPGLHGAQSQRPCPAASCGSPYGDPGRAGSLREGRQQCGAPLHRARRLGAAHVHHVVPRRRAAGGRLPAPPHATGSQSAGGLRRRAEHDWLINHRVGQEARYWQLHM